MIQWHKTDLSSRVYLNLPDGKKKSMPRYYRDKIYTSEERGFLKGEFERIFRERDLDLIRKCKVQTMMDREQAVLAAFRRMELSDNKFKV